MLNGMTVHLRLYQNGYVRFDGMLDVAVQIPETEWQMLLDVLENKTAAQRVQVPDPDEVQLEKCLSDPELGGFIPNWSPDGLELNMQLFPIKLTVKPVRKLAQDRLCSIMTTRKN